MQQVASGDGARCNNAGRLKPGTAAQQLGIHRSSLKRYLAQYPELLGDDGKVDLAQLRKHRADNPSVAEAVRKVEQRQAARETERETRREDVEPPKSDGIRTDSKSRLEKAKADEAEIDLAERLGQLVDPGEMLDAVSEAANFLREKILFVDFTQCERFAAEKNPLVIKAIILEERVKLAAALKEKFDKIITSIVKRSADEPS